MSTIAERVAAGAAFLDEYRPGWDQGIALALLDIQSCDRCVLGQLFGDYGPGMDWLLDRAPAADTRDYGFMFGGADQDAEGRDASALTAEWRRVIEQRRAAS